MLLSSSWSITLVCFLFSVALLIWYEQHTEHRPDGGELAYIPGANPAQPQRVIIVQQQQQPQQTAPQEPGAAGPARRPAAPAPGPVQPPAPPPPRIPEDFMGIY